MINYVKGFISVCGGVLSFLLGGFDSLAVFLVYIMLLDIISGMMRATQEEGLSSSKMLKGGMKKFSMLLVVFVSTLIDKTFLINIVLRDIVIMFFITNEGLSFIENILIFIELPVEFLEFFKGNKERGKEIE